MVLAIDGEVIVGVDYSHSTHHSGEVQDDVYATYGPRAEGGVTEVAHDDLDVRGGFGVGGSGYVRDAYFITPALS